MTALPKLHMHVAQFLALAEDAPGRHELFDGTVYAMSPEGAEHAKVKFAVHTAPAAGIVAAAPPAAR